MKANVENNEMMSPMDRREMKQAAKARGWGVADRVVANRLAVQQAERVTEDDYCLGKHIDIALADAERIYEMPRLPDTQKREAQLKEGWLKESRGKGQ